MALSYIDVNQGEFYKRLKEERKSRGVTQEEMGHYLWMDQTLYSRIENGNKRLTYYQLKGLCKSKLDISYIFTGKRHSDFEFEHVLDVEFGKLLFCLGAINLLAAEKGKNNLEWKKLYLDTKDIEYLHCSLNNKTNLFKTVRVLNGLKQAEMVERVGVDIKKLRCLELEKTLPDNELLLIMYEVFGISPALFLQDEKFLRNDICCIIENGSPDVRRTLKTYIEYILELLKK